MNGLFKGVFITAGTLAVVIYMGWFKMQETSHEIKAESAAFDRDWNEAMEKFAGSKAERNKHTVRAATAQSRYSTAQVTLERATKKNEQIGEELDQAKTAADGKAIDRELDRAGRGMK